MPVPVPLRFRVAAVLVYNVVAGLLIVVGEDTVGFVLVDIAVLLAITALLLSGFEVKRLLATQLLKLGLRAAFKS